MSRIVVRPPFLLHPEELPASSIVNVADPLAATVNGAAMARVNALLVETMRAGSEYPEELKALVRAAKTPEELEAVLLEIARWRASRGGLAG